MNENKPGTIPQSGTTKLQMGKLGGSGCGIGDCLQALLAVKGYQAKHNCEVKYYIAKHLHQWAKLFHTNLGELTPQGNVPCPIKNLNDGYEKELLTEAQVSRIERYCLNAGGVDPVIPKIINPTIFDEKYKDYIAICPYSVHPVRNWHDRGWHSLFKLLGDRPVVVITDRIQNTKLKHWTQEKIISAHPEIVAQVLNSVRCVVGVDTGIMHLAGILGKPLIVLHGPTDARKIFNCYGNLTAIGGKLYCGNCWFQKRNGFAPECNIKCSNLATIDPHEVFRAIEDN